MIEEFAPAKVNLALHVTGRRADGYHLLDSLVAFSDAGDRLSFERADLLSLEVTGPYGTGLAGPDNLVMKAAQALAGLAKTDKGARIRLEKNLPVASGIGGGSSDAAATLRGLMRLWDHTPDTRQLARIALGLGADVPVCLAATRCRMTGVGETLMPADALPPLAAVLVNPNRAVSTPAVFRLLDLNPESEGRLPLDPLPQSGARQEWLAWLNAQRNDLEPPATDLEPSIGEVLTALRDNANCRLARLSGSGATCFGLFDDEAASLAASSELSRRHPDWWVRACSLS